MLAHKFLDHVETALSWIHIALQFKYDGVRCLNVGDELYTRTGKIMYAVPHIKEEVNEIFISGTGVSELDLDGELYNHDLKDDFNELTSIVRKQKLEESDIQKSKELMQYHIYDIISTTQTFFERYSLLKYILEETEYKHLCLAPTVFLDNSEGQITKEILYEYLTEYQSLGYEGMMIRNADSFYENKRTKNLLKWKEFEDDEFELIGIEEGRGNRAGMAAKVFCKDKRGEEFSAGLRGTTDYCRQLLIDKDKLIGKQVTIRYQNLTPDRKVPRFGKMLAVRDYE